MAMVEVKCPICESVSVSKNGKTPKGVQRYACNNKDCPRKIFMLEYAYNGSKPGIDEQIVKMTANASGIRDISRFLEISTDKDPSGLEVEILSWEEVFESELDEMWSFVRTKKNQRWLWLAIDHETRSVLAFVFGERKDVVFKKLRTFWYYPFLFR